MRTLVNKKDNAQYTFHIKGSLADQRDSIDISLRESSFYNFAEAHEATFSGYRETKNSRFVDNL